MYIHPYTIHPYECTLVKPSTRYATFDRYPVSFSNVFSFKSFTAF